MSALFQRITFIVFTVVAATSQAQVLYWANTGAGRIERRLPDGTVEVVVVGGLPRGLAIDPVQRKVYWVDGATETLRRADINGTNEEDLVVGTAGVGGGVALDRAAGKVYWTDVAVGDVFRANLDGSEAELLGNLFLHLQDISLDLDAGKMYLAATSNDSILRANLDLSGVETLIAGVPSVKTVAVDPSAGVLYWSDHVIHQSLLADAADTVDLANTAAADLALDAASQTLYWTTLSSNGRVNTDGSALETFSTAGLDAARSIVVAFPRGDVECDGDIDVGDAAVLVDVLLGMETDGLRVAQADVNGSGTADGEDVGALVELLVGS